VFIIKLTHFKSGLENKQVLLKKPAGRSNTTFDIGFSSKTDYLKQAFNGKCPCLGVNISHNATLKYATILGSQIIRFK
jgi:hypothetical protein